MRVDELDRVYRELREAAAGPPETYAQVLERALAACEADPAAAEYLDVLELHDELAEAYDRLAGWRTRCGTRTCWSKAATRASRIRAAGGRRS